MPRYRVKVTAYVELVAPNAESAAVGAVDEVVEALGFADVEADVEAGEEDARALDGPQAPEDQSRA